MNVHIHALVLDGVYAPNRAGRLRFWRGSAAGPNDLEALLVVIVRRVNRLLTRRGLSSTDDGCGEPDAWADETPMLAGLAAASVQGVAALGTRTGIQVRRWGDAIDRPEPPPPTLWHAHRDGFDVHAAIVVRAKARDRLERLCRYALRPPVGQDRLQAMPDGTFVLELRRRWRDGTTHVIFDPVELLERLAVLVPRPRINLVLYHGVLAPRAAWRSAIVPAPPLTPGSAPAADAGTPAPDRSCHHVCAPNRPWAELMQRGFGFDVLACPRCSGRLKLVALIRDGAVIRRILRHLGLPEQVPRMRPAREPPLVSAEA